MICVFFCQWSLLSSIPSFYYEMKHIRTHAKKRVIIKKKIIIIKKIIVNKTFVLTRSHLPCWKIKIFLAYEKGCSATWLVMPLGVHVGCEFYCQAEIRCGVGWFTRCPVFEPSAPTPGSIGDRVGIRVHPGPDRSCSIKEFISADIDDCCK